MKQTKQRNKFYLKNDCGLVKTLIFAFRFEKAQS